MNRTKSNGVNLQQLMGGTKLEQGIWLYAMYVSIVMTPETMEFRASFALIELTN